MAIYSFGSNGNYQLGIGTDEDVSSGTPVLMDERVRAISSGGNHTLFITESGELWGVGLNNSGQLGIDEPLKNITAPRRINTDGNKLGLVCAGWEYSLAVTDDGKTVYACGAGPKGELGLGSNTINTKSPVVIENFPPEGKTVVSIQAGMSHVLALLNDGSVYGWGAGRKGQLGEPIEKMVFRPRKIFDSSSQISHIGCGRDFSVFASSPGKNTITVLGDDRVGIKSQKPEPHNGGIIKDIGCGWSNAHVLYTDGTVQSWGNNSHGQHVPLDEVKKIQRFAVGTEHVIAIDEDNKMIAWGWGEHGNCGEKHVDGSATLILHDGTNVGLIHSGYANSWYGINRD